MARSHRDRRSAHRTRTILDGLTAAEIALVVLLEAMVDTQPRTAQQFVRGLDRVLARDTAMTSGARWSSVPRRACAWWRAPERKSPSNPKEAASWLARMKQRTAAQLSMSSIGGAS
ncbi:MAG: hypothetical protein FJY54_12115 [Betaproteobacteria bacterium]|nr:hypothetical protein [Betaproteobacteria bacterium]